MPRCHHDEPHIPFWRIFLVGCFALPAIAGCADRDQRAVQEAMVAQKALSAHDLPTAHKAIIAAIADRDDLADYHILQGRIELAGGSSTAAFNAYRNALALDATNTEALLEVAQLGLTTGNLRDSLDATERLMDLVPNRPDVLLLRGIHSMIAHNYPEAINYSNRVLALSPDYIDGAVLKARALFLLGKPREALATLEGPSNEVASSESAALTRLEIYRAQGQASSMLAEFARLRALRPRDLALRLDEANLRFKLGDRSGGQALVQHVLGSREADRTTADQAISLWQEYGAQDVSSMSLERISSQQSSASRVPVARFLLDQGRAADAAYALAAFSPRSGDGLKARLLLLEGKDVQAGQVAQATLARDKTDCDALVAASGSALKRHLADDGLRFAQQAASECPSMTSAWLLAASAYYALGNGSGVSRVYGQALVANKQSAPLTVAYTRWLVSQGRKREAVAIARRLTQYAPALLSGWRQYQNLCQQFDASCVAEATDGRAKASTLLGVDLPPGEPPPNGLLGRFVEQ